MASASNSFDKNIECSITVTMPDPTKDEFKNYAEDLPDVPDDLEYDLYKVASATPSSKGDDSYTFTATKDFSSLETGLDELADMNSLSSDAVNDYGSKYKELAQIAAGVVRDDSSVDKATTCNINKPTASGLGSGLYLVLVHGDKPKDYFAESDGNIITVANGKDSKFTFLPELVAVPGKSLKSGGSTAGNGAWQYTVEAVLKPSWEPLYGSLDIVKTLRTFDNGKAATFVFDIEGRDSSNKVIYSNTASLVFNGATSQVAHIDQIPAGLKVTVTEVYSGASYKLTSQPEQNATIVADDAVSVEFENDYNGSGNSGGSVTNSFSYQQGEDGNGQWTWSKDGEEQR